MSKCFDKCHNDLTGVKLYDMFQIAMTDVKLNNRCHFFVRRQNVLTDVELYYRCQNVMTDVKIMLYYYFYKKLEQWRHLKSHSINCALDLKEGNGLSKTIKL